MNGETFQKYEEMVGGRAYLDGLEQACEVLDELPCSDLFSLLTIVSHNRAQQTNLATVLNGNRFHVPSAVSQRLFHHLEAQIFDSLPGVDFVELSPLQPFGTNAVIAGTNQKNVVSALRRSEANADATTSLFREAMSRYLELDAEDTVRLATNVRTTRAQIFDPKTSFLPHFKVFAETSVGTQNQHYGQRELEALSDHLATEVTILQRAKNMSGSRMADIHIAIGNVMFTQDLIERGLVEELEVRQNTANPEYSLLDEAGIDMPSEIPFESEDLLDILKSMGYKRGIRITDNFQKIISERYPELMPHIVLDLGRIAGLGYYKHMAYKMSAHNTEGLSLPLADGGTTRWAERGGNSKQIFCATSGIGTELLCAYFLDSEKL